MKAQPITGYVGVVHELPPCDLPGCDRTARYDFRTLDGRWANGCEPCFISTSADIHLGLGKGQYLVTQSEIDNGKPIPSMLATREIELMQADRITNSLKVAS